MKAQVIEDKDGLVEVDEVLFVCLDLFMEVGLVKANLGICQKIRICQKRF